MTKTAELMLTSALLVVLFSVPALIFVKVNGDLGITLFIVMPALAGFVAGMTTRAIWRGLIVLATTFAAMVAYFLWAGLEGLLCVVLVLPLFALLAYGGVLAGRFAGKRVFRHGGVAAVLVALLIVGCSTLLEGRNPAAVHVVETVRDFPESPARAWQAMLEFRQITGDKPWMLRLGLPVPQYCTIEGSGVGAIRTCHFDQGVIRERISVWEPPHRLVMTITEVTLPGRDWLQFVDASYDLGTTQNGETRIRRTTKIGSVLRPRFYWEPLETMAVQAEHEYLMNALAAKLNEAPSAGPWDGLVPSRRVSPGPQWPPAARRPPL